MLLSVEIIKVLALLSAVITFFWKYWEYRKSYPQIGLTVDSKDGNAFSAMTSVEKKGAKLTRIDYALLLIGPENETPIETFNQIATQANEIAAQYNKTAAQSNKINTVIETNEIAKCKLMKTFYGPNGRSLIPLPFYYSENVAIADEKLSYRAHIDSEEILTGVPYSVRLFVQTNGQLHRSTHDSFIRNPA